MRNNISVHLYKKISYLFMSFESLEELYEQITHLRRKGVKMKDIANYTDLPSSVISALYSTVLPVFINNSERLGKEEALDYALSQVNNVSKKRIISSIPDICRQLRTFKPDYSSQSKDTFIGTLNRFAAESGNIGNDYLGLYDSYSLSSACNALKIEPFVLSSGEAGEINVVRKSAYNSINKGTAIISNGESLYIMLNELDESKLALVTIYLQLPFYEKAKFLRGIYITLDYNRNPVARRILFVKRDDLPDIPDFSLIEGKLILKEKLGSELTAYYNYVSEVSDIIKMCSIPFPKFNQEDLISEKQILLTINKQI